MNQMTDVISCYCTRALAKWTEKLRDRRREKGGGKLLKTARM